MFRLFVRTISLWPLVWLCLSLLQKCSTYIKERIRSVYMISNRKGKIGLLVDTGAVQNLRGKDFMHKAIDSIPPDADFASIVYLPFADRSCCDRGWCKIQPRIGFGGTQMYYVTPRGASILLEQALPIVSQVDVYIGYVSNTREDFKGVFYEQEYFTQFQFWTEYHKSTIGHDIEIKKFLPENNWFYLGWSALIILWALISFRIGCSKKIQTGAKYK